MSSLTLPEVDEMLIRGVPPLSSSLSSSSSGKSSSVIGGGGGGEECSFGGTGGAERGVGEGLGEMSTSILIGRGLGLNCGTPGSLGGREGRVAACRVDDLGGGGGGAPPLTPVCHVGSGDDRLGGMGGTREGGTTSLGEYVVSL